MPARNIITITTDFGVRDHFVGAMKGVILTINPEANLLDISHDVASYSVVDGAFTIAQAYPYFPSDTVHLVVVDPGVGGERRPILVQAGRHYFVGPDNGVFSFIYEREERVTVRHITASHYFLQPVSRTFHGRDIFSPIAAWLTKGIDAVEFRRADQRLPAFRQPESHACESENRARGIVLKADKFGNLITNFSIALFSAVRAAGGPGVPARDQRTTAHAFAQDVRRGSARRDLCDRGFQRLSGNRMQWRGRRRALSRPVPAMKSFSLFSSCSLGLAS